MDKFSREYGPSVVGKHHARSLVPGASRCRGLDRLPLLAMFVILLSTSLASGPFLPDELLSRVKDEYGRGAERSLIRWQDFIIKNADKSEAQKLALVNRYFNAIPYASDLKVWGVKDYWATPVEFLVRDRGDCEDYAIAKYFTLRKLGVAPEKLRVLYVHVSERAGRSYVGRGLNESLAHMVLAYYETPTSSPLILA